MTENYTICQAHQWFSNVQKKPSAYIKCVTEVEFNRDLLHTAVHDVANKESIHTTTIILWPFFQYHLGELVPEEKLLDFMVQGKINRGRHSHINSLAGCLSIWTNQCPPPPSRHFLQARCPSCRPTNSVNALKATSAFGLGRRR